MWYSCVYQIKYVRLTIHSYVIFMCVPCFCMIIKHVRLMTHFIMYSCIANNYSILAYNSYDCHGLYTTVVQIYPIIISIHFIQVDLLDSNVYLYNFIWISCTNECHHGTSKCIRQNVLYIKHVLNVMYGASITRATKS